MAGKHNESNPVLDRDVNPAAALEQAFKEIAKGEHTATQMEIQLSRIEKQIDDLLAASQDIGPSRDAGPSNSTTNRSDNIAK